MNAEYWSILALFCSDVSQAISVRKVNSTSHTAPLLIKCLNFLNVAKTLLISRVSLRREEIKVQVQETFCLRSGIAQSPTDDCASMELCGVRITVEVRKGVV